MWSLGVTLYCMIFNCLPFWDNDNCGNEFSVLEIICRNDVIIPENREIIENQPSDKDYSISQKTVDLLLRLLDKNPETRMTIEELCSWFD